QADPRKQRTDPGSGDDPEDPSSDGNPEAGHGQPGRSLAAGAGGKAAVTPRSSVTAPAATRSASAIPGSSRAPAARAPARAAAPAGRRSAPTLLPGPPPGAARGSKRPADARSWPPTIPVPEAPPRPSPRHGG